ncbi:hypothetical protein OGAPHI_005572 [Ogataea philodendri]|uniref:Uncharacterized protein n=1 Tax=Ogataea philodendri TaxID=1378263 RepID=A0A9P8NZV8_9ASCO|nr:uncharacterized protein OGAPHI_005572 [Ogataea philodendri]KAH3662321.1 hypothetical protein OGAPHI_005572 [Ogataea philodendri]
MAQETAVFTLESSISEEIAANGTAHDVVELFLNELVAVIFEDLLFSLTNSTMTAQSATKGTVIAASLAFSTSISNVSFQRSFLDPLVRPRSTSSILIETMDSGFLVNIGEAMWSTLRTVDTVIDKTPVSGFFLKALMTAFSRATSSMSMYIDWYCLSALRIS